MHALRSQGRGLTTIPRTTLFDRHLVSGSLIGYFRCGSSSIVRLRYGSDVMALTPRQSFLLLIAFGVCPSDVPGEFPAAKLVQSPTPGLADRQTRSLDEVALAQRADDRVLHTGRVESLTDRIVHTVPSAYRHARSVHGGAGELHYQGLLDNSALTTNFLFLHRGVIPPKGGIGHHFHHKMEEMYIILDNEAEFTINGRTSRLRGPAGAPCKMGQSHAIYNPTEKPTQWINIAVTSVKGKYDNFDLNDDRVGAPLDPKPVFVTAQFDRELLQPMQRIDGGQGTILGRRVLSPEVFSTPWAYVDHLIVPPGASTGRRKHLETEEVYYVIRGLGLVQVNEQQTEIRAGDAIPIRFNETQSFTNDSQEDLELLVIGVAPAKPKAPR